jgi:predicted RNase H-like HicB family nuclease
MTNYIAIMEGDGNVWGLRIPDLPGCFGGGPDADAAMADTISAARDWAEHQAGKGIALRKPRAMSAIIADPDVEFNPATEWCVTIPVFLDRGRAVKANVSLDAGMLEVIDAEAAKRGLTRSAFLVSAALDKIERGA